MKQVFEWLGEICNALNDNNPGMLRVCAPDARGHVAVLWDVPQVNIQDACSAL